MTCGEGKEKGRTSQSARAYMKGKQQTTHSHRDLARLRRCSPAKCAREYRQEPSFSPKLGEKGERTWMTVSFVCAYSPSAWQTAVCSIWTSGEVAMLRRCCWSCSCPADTLNVRRPAAGRSVSTFASTWSCRSSPATAAWRWSWPTTAGRGRARTMAVRSMLSVFYLSYDVRTVRRGMS